MLSDSQSQYVGGRKSSQSHESEIVFRAAGFLYVVVRMLINHHLDHQGT